MIFYKTIKAWQTGKLSPSVRRFRNTSFLSAAIITCLSMVCFALPRGNNSPSQSISLSPARKTGSVSLEQLLSKRRSVREFGGKSLNHTQIGQLAWAGQSITEANKGYRTAPSAGGIYPITLYFATRDGFFSYNPQLHALEEVASTDMRGKIAAVAQQEVIGAAPCNIIIAGSIAKLVPKYAHKSRRFMMMEAGHVAQNILLQAVSLQLAAVSVGDFETVKIATVCNLPAGLEPIYIICVGYPLQSALIADVKESDVQKEASEMTAVEKKKAVLIIPSENFRDEELFSVQAAIAKINAEGVVASSKKGSIRGMLGGKAEAAILISEIVVDDYDAVIFIGGSGAREYFNNKPAMNIASEARDKEKILAAICIAPTILANAGLLDGVRATSFPSEQAALKKAGAIYTGSDVEKDGMIITGSGPKAAEEFGRAVADAIATAQ